MAKCRCPVCDKPIGFEEATISEHMANSECLVRVIETMQARINELEERLDRADMYRQEQSER